MSAHLALGAVAALALAAAGYRRKQGSTSALPRFDAESDYVVKGVGEKSGRFIRIPAHAAGLGGTPNNDNIDYLGFVAWMTPSDFLRLNPDRPVLPRPQSKAAWAQKGIGAPMLYVDLVDDSRQSIADLILDLEDESEVAMRALERVSPTLRVRSHEGRGRAMFIREHLGEALMPVAVVPKGLRARHLAAAPGLLQRAVFTDLSGARRVPMGRFQLAGEMYGAPQGQTTGSLSLRHGKRRLWAGTQRRNLESIFERGLVPQGGAQIHRTKTRGVIFLAGSREGALRYADYSDVDGETDPAIVEVDVEGLELYPDRDDAGRDINQYIKEIEEISGVTVRDDDFVDGDDVEAVREAIGQIESPITATVELDEDGHYFRLIPRVKIYVDRRLNSDGLDGIDIDDRIKLEDQVIDAHQDEDDSDLAHLVEQYQHYGKISASKILGAYVRAQGAVPDIHVLNFGKIDGIGSSKGPHWRREPLVFVKPPPRQQATGSLSRPQAPRAELQRLRRAALRVAAQDTAYDADAYRTAQAQGRSPLVGHCNAMAYVVQSRLGGEIVEGRAGKERHMWNRLPNGVEVDLTSDQYGGDGLTPVASPRRDVPARAAVNKRFAVFRDRVVRQLEGARS
jgi:hypothetical protein